MKLRVELYAPLVETGLTGIERQLISSNGIDNKSYLIYTYLLQYTWPYTSFLFAKLTLTIITTKITFKTIDAHRKYKYPGPEFFFLFSIKLDS